jgi:heat shock protein HslJ
VQVGTRDAAVRLRLGSETRDLAQVESASGARYSDGGLPETSFWSRGDRATAVWSGVQLPECAPFPDPARQTVTARGNEPGWVMTAGPDGLSLSTEAGEALAGALPPPRLTAEAITWAIPGGPALTLAPGQCNDSMTGMPYPMTATLSHDGQTLAGCAGDPADLLAGDWRVTELADAPLPDGADGSLRFESGQVSGRAFCNRFTGGFTITGEGLRFGPAAATRMACPPDRMAAEGAFLAALAKVDRFDITADGTLELVGGDRVLLRAAR